jgi:hypothetical protein
MIKALTTPGEDGSRTLLLGLSDENWTRLRAGQPIPVRLQALDPTLPPLTVVIVGGATEDEIYEDLRAHVKIRNVHANGGDPR